ncbi:hypothetical protein D3C72_1778400 [compost metagenome]
MVAGVGQALLRQAAGLVVRAVEAREVPAHDFFLRIALGALRAGVPVGDRAIGMQHVDGIVDDTLHKVPVHDVGIGDDHWMRRAGAPAALRQCAGASSALCKTWGYTDLRRGHGNIYRGAKKNINPSGRYA